MHLGIWDVRVCGGKWWAIIAAGSRDSPPPSTLSAILHQNANGASAPVATTFGGRTPAQPGAHRTDPQTAFRAHMPRFNRAEQDRGGVYVCQAPTVRAEVTIVLWQWL